MSERLEVDTDNFRVELSDGVAEPEFCAPGGEAGNVFCQRRSKGSVRFGGSAVIRSFNAVHML
jgi:hypothetical protein